jgi:hypothetical protein
VKQLFLGLLAVSAWAQSVADTDLELALPAAPKVILRLGGEADSAQGRKYQGKVTWNATRKLTLFLSGDRSNLASTNQAPSPNGNATTTTTTSLGGSYYWGLAELGAQIDRSTMSDLLSSQRTYLQPSLDGGTWRLGLELSTRRTDFDRLRFTGRTITTPTGPATVSGYADLNLRDRGVGGNFEFGGEVWRLFGSYTHYSYDDFEGSSDVTRIRNTAGQVSPEVFKALYAGLVERFKRIATSNLSTKAALLDSTATLGLEASFHRSKWVLEIDQDVDHLTGEGSDTYKGVASWKATPAFTLEVQVGATRSETFGTDRFAGLALIFRFGNTF